MINKHNKTSKSECAVCYSTHDEEIHEATLRIHRWFLGQVTRNFVDDTFVVPELQPVTDSRFGMPVFYGYMPPTALAMWSDESTELEQRIRTPC
ncbi:MAG: hypothetical protein ABI759_11435 [Candidatus Solibacter sp.]